MRLDHIAFRITDKTAALSLLHNLLGYNEESPFEIVFEDGTKVACMTMVPPEKVK